MISWMIKSALVPTECREVCSVLCGQPGWEWSFGGRMDTCVCLAESLHWSSETTTTPLIGRTPMQNVFGVKNKVKKENELVQVKRYFCVLLSDTSSSLCSGRYLLHHSWAKVIQHLWPLPFELSTNYYLCTPSWHPAGGKSY